MVISFDKVMDPAAKKVKIKTIKIIENVAVVAYGLVVRIWRLEFLAYY